jgi:hypothetical protein
MVRSGGIIFQLSPALPRASSSDPTSLARPAALAPHDRRQVYPSGAARATETAPVIERAPGRFSITKDWP